MMLKFLTRDRLHLFLRPADVMRISGERFGLKGDRKGQIHKFQNASRGSKKGKTR